MCIRDSNNGKDKIVAEVKNGFFQGLYHSYHKNGHLESSGINIKGKKFGLWKFYNKSNKLTQISKYNEDTIQFDYNREDFPTRKFDVVSSKSSIFIPNSWKEIGNKNEQNLLLELEKECSNSCLLYTSDAADDSTLCRSRWSPYH